MSTVTINAQQRLFVIPCGRGFTCLGFDVVFKRLKQYAQKLGLAAPDAAHIGTMTQYEQYQSAEAAYIGTGPQETLFDPDTAPEVARLLEAYRRSGERVRLFFGDPASGRAWMEEHDVVGTVGRTTGPLKSPILLSSARASGGCIISTANIVRIIDVATRQQVYRHPSFRIPDIAVRDSLVPDYETEVLVDGCVHARFKSRERAMRWVGFMKGERMRAY